MALHLKFRWIVLLVCVCTAASPAVASAKKSKPAPAPAPSGTSGSSGTAGVHALWHMDETSGTTMIDSVGGHNGTISSVQLGVPGFSGTAYNFTRGTVTVPSSSTLNPGSANITVTIHVKPSGAPATPDWDLFRKGQYTTAGGEWKMEYQPNGAPSCGFKGSKYAELTAGRSINDGRWHTVSCVKTASAIQVVVDGQAFTKSVVIGSISNSAPVIMASYPGAEFFHGALDEASISFG